MITASHNPATDNGYKVYMSDGAQVIPPTGRPDRRGPGPSRATLIPTDPDAGLIEDVDEAEVVGAYRRAVLGFLDLVGPRGVRIVYTPLHGVGGAVMPELLELAGFEDVSVVAAQAAPDPDFPTVSFPNPEEPGALDLALDDATRLGADLVLANDPDGTGWRSPCPTRPAAPGGS